MRQASVLIVDGDSDRRARCRQHVTASGHLILAEAQSQSQALTLARSLRPEVIVIDLRAPTPSGWEIARIIGLERLSALLLVGDDTDAAHLWDIESTSVMGFFRETPPEGELQMTLPLAGARFRERVALEEEVRDLNERMEARKLVGRAKAILMERQNLSERDAFRRIQSQSLSLGKPVQEIARAIITASEMSTPAASKEASVAPPTRIQGLDDLSE